MPHTFAGRPWAHWVTFLARQILGITLIVAGALKVGWPEASVQAVRGYQLLPFDLTRPVGYALPVIELVLGLLLVTGLFTRVAAWLGAGIMVAFIIGIAWVWSQGISIECGCFGGGGEVEGAIASYPWHIAGNIGLTACGVWAALFPASPFSLDAKLFAVAPSSVEEAVNEPQHEESPA
ncbi:MAG: MauE/DoxX family redox-associated membrane protein [Micropruina sp.]|nr:DoxX family membrane protein [Micropruina sp.]